MADTGDLRSEEKNSDTKSARDSRARRRLLKMNGLCTMCGKVEIGGAREATCYKCSKLQSHRTYKSGLRSFLTTIGVDWENDKSMTKHQISMLLELARAKS